MAIQVLCLLVLLPAALTDAGLAAAPLEEDPSAECSIMGEKEAHCGQDGHVSLLQQDLTLQRRMVTNQAEAEDRSAEAIPPVSTTMKCIISVSFQFFIVYTALQVVRTIQVFTSPEKPYMMETVLNEALETVTFAPMISVLFIATRMRALTVTDDKPDQYGLPQSWCQTGMAVCTIAVAALTIVNVAAGTLKAYAPGHAGAGVMGLFAAARSLSLAALYICMGVVCYGLYSMDRPKELGGSVPVSDAATCVMNLTFQYFLVQLLLQASRTYDQLKASGMPDATLITSALDMAQTTVYYAPMLSILFLAARMRALQMGLDAPQGWARIFFYLSTYCILGKILLTVAATLFSGMAPKKGTTEGEVELPEVKSPVWKVLTILNWLLTAALYVSMTAVLVSVFTITAPEGTPTPPISTTVRIVLGLTLQFFAVYILLWGFLTVKEYGVTWGIDGINRVLRVLYAARNTCMFCPMLSVLFVGTRMRALQLTDNKGAPQGWVQDCMQLSAWSLAIQLIMVVLTELFALAGQVMESLKGESATKILATVTTILEYVCTLMLYGGAVGVMVGLFYMTPENANGTGNLIPGVKIPSSTPSVGSAGGSQ